MYSRGDIELVTVEKLHVLTHRNRHKIVTAIREGQPEDNYLAKIARQTDIDPKVVKFHVRVLEREGLVETSLVPSTTSGNPVFVRQVRLTKDAQETLEKYHL